MHMPPVQRITVDLSDEIWQQVFSHLRLTVPSHEQWVDFSSERARLQALSSTCLVSKRFSRIAQPLLYQRLPELLFSRSSLRRSLAERPDLAGFVRHVHFGESYMDEESVRRDVDAAMRTCPAALREQVREMERSLRDGTGDAQDIAVAVFILLMKNLERLSITVLDRYEYIISVVNGSAIPQGNPSSSGRAEDATPDNGPLTRLRVLTLSNWEGKDSVPMIDMWAMLKPPTLERFEGYSIKVCLWGLEQPSPPFTNQNLKEVQLLYSLVDADGLQAILRLLPGLRKLRIAWGPPTVGDCDTLDLGLMGQVLRESAARELEVLDLDFRESFNYEQEETKGRLGSLWGLAGLKELSVQPTVLVGDTVSDWPDSDSEDDHNAPPLPLVDVLPEQPEYLCLYQGARETEWTEEDAKSLIGSERLPNLQTAVLR